MRDQHKPKQQLIDEVLALRKQVADLKEAGSARRRVEEALRASEEQYRTLVEGLAAPVCRLDALGGLLVANAALAALLGYRSKGEMVELAGVLGFFSATEDARRVLLELDRLGEAAAQLRRKDAGAVAVRLRATVARDPTGRAQRFDVLVLPSPDPA
jgi:PAS domain-containing protein